jgi:anti-sigma28 factor (negative regulator of flagellin synthesis)
MSVRRIKLYDAGAPNDRKAYKHRTPKEEELGERLRSPEMRRPNVRKALVERIRAEIASGNYDNDHKLDLAVEKMISEFKADLGES